VQWEGSGMAQNLEKFDAIFGRDLILSYLDPSRDVLDAHLDKATSNSLFSFRQPQIVLILIFTRRIMGEKDPLDGIPHTRKEPRPDFSKPLPGKPLPKELQDTLNNEEKLWEIVNDESPYVQLDFNMTRSSHI
jgi:hypothetical protein